MKEAALVEKCPDRGESGFRWQNQNCIHKIEEGGVEKMG